MTTQSGDYKSYLKQLEDTLELYMVKKAPALPPGVKEAIVQFGPWVILILMIITLPFILAVFGIATFLMPFSIFGGVTFGITYFITVVLSCLTLVLRAIALPGLFRRARSAWYLVYYAALISALERLLTLNIVGFIIGSLISFYILFQIKEYYS